MSHVSLHQLPRWRCGRPGAQPWLKSWGGPRFGSRAKGRAGCWVREGVAPPAVRVGGITITILAVKFLAFWKLRPRSWGDQCIVSPQPKSSGTSLPRSLRLLRLWERLWQKWLSQVLVPFANYVISVSLYKQPRSVLLMVAMVHSRMDYAVLVGRCWML